MYIYIYIMFLNNGCHYYDGDFDDGEVRNPEQFSLAYVPLIFCFTQDHIVSTCPQNCLPTDLEEIEGMAFEFPKNASNEHLKKMHSKSMCFNAWFERQDTKESMWARAG